MQVRESENSNRKLLHPSSTLVKSYSSDIIIVHIFLNYRNQSIY